MKLSSRNIVNQRTSDFVLVEPYLDPKLLQTNGLVHKALYNAELINFVSACPKAVYPIAVTEFYGNLNRETYFTHISTRKKVKSGFEEGNAALNLIEAAYKLGLRNVGENVEHACSDDLTAELRRYSSSPTEKYVRGQNSSSCLKSHFKTLMDISTRVILSHYGNLSTITPVKLQVMAALCDEVQGIEYNWAAFIMKQWTEVAREVEATANPETFKMGAKLRFGTKISFVLKQLQPNLDDRFPSEAKKKPMKISSADASVSRSLQRPLAKKSEEKKEIKSRSKTKGKGKEKVDDKKEEEVEEQEKTDDDTAAKAKKEEKEEEKEGRAERSRRRHSIISVESPSPSPKRSRKELRREAKEAQPSLSQLPVIQVEAPPAPAPAATPAPAIATVPRIPHEATLRSAMMVEDEAMAKVKHHFRGIQLPEGASELLCDFLTYARLRGTECSKFLKLTRSVGIENMKEHEASLLSTFNSTSFDDFINYTKVWDHMEEYVVSLVPDARDKLPERDASPSEILSSLHDIKTLQAELQAESDKFKATAREAEKEHNNLKAALEEKDEIIRGLRKQLQEKESLASSSSSQDLTMRISNLLAELHENRASLQVALADRNKPGKVTGADTDKGEK